MLVGGERDGAGNVKLEQRKRDYKMRRMVCPGVEHIKTE
jgi:hypothetical protein